MSDFCDELDNLMVMGPDQLQDLIDTIVNKELLDSFQYDKVNLKPDDPANPHCSANQAACWNDEDETLYYKGDQITRHPEGDDSGSVKTQERFVEALVHEALHAMDYQDGRSEDELGDEIADHPTYRLYDEYGEDGEHMYSPGDLIPGDEHMEEVYEPAREIAEELTDLCEELKKAKSPQQKESIKSAIQRAIQEILEDRWEPDDDEEDYEEYRRRHLEQARPLKVDNDPL